MELDLKPDHYPSVVEPEWRTWESGYRVTVGVKITETGIGVNLLLATEVGSRVSEHWPEVWSCAYWWPILAKTTTIWFYNGEKMPHDFGKCSLNDIIMCNMNLHVNRRNYISKWDKKKMNREFHAGSHCKSSIFFFFITMLSHRIYQGELYKN